MRQTETKQQRADLSYNTNYIKCKYTKHYNQKADVWGPIYIKKLH